MDEIVTVDDEEIASAILMLLEQEKTLAEGAGAAALAAIVQSKTNLRPRRTVVMVCGGNIDVTLLAKIIERGLVKDGRLLRIRVYLLDRPGALQPAHANTGARAGQHCGNAAQPRLLRR